MDSVIQPVDLGKSYRLLNHGPVTLVTSAYQDRRNVMAASWVMPLDFDPPKVALVVDARTVTRELIEASGEFALSVPCLAMARQVLAAGSASGRGQDKLSSLGFEVFSASKVRSSLIKGCVAWLECRVISEPSNQSKYDLFVAEVVAAWADPAVFSEGRWHFPDSDSRTIHYLAGGSFFATGELVDISDSSP